jgi:hypothetical protein
VFRLSCTSSPTARKPKFHIKPLPPHHSACSIGLLISVSNCSKLIFYLWVPGPTLHEVTCYYLTLRSVLSLNNPQNSEMKSCENLKLSRWKSS